MPLGIAAAIFFFLAGGVAGFIYLYSKSKQALFIVLAVVAGIIAMAALAYCALTFIFLADVSDLSLR